MRSLTGMLGTFIVTTILATGCAGTYEATPVGPSYSADLVEVAPGVQVIADYDEPIFYSDGFYWRYYGNTWYRSPYYTGGWVLARPPVAILRIDRPHAYVHYHPPAWAGRHRVVGPPPPSHRYYGRPGPEPRRVGPPAAQPRFYQTPPPHRVGPPAPPMAAPHGPPPRPPMHRGPMDRR